MMAGFETNGKDRGNTTPGTVKPEGKYTLTGGSTSHILESIYSCRNGSWRLYNDAVEACDTFFCVIRKLNEGFI
jgi:hypothetical protein